MSDSATLPNDADLDLLSAYLDGELVEPDRASLEQRLASNAALRAELESLRQTVGLLHDLPRLRAPRDFTLDPAIYGQRSPWWRRALASPTILQVSGALGVAASVILIAAALLSTNPTTQDSDLAAAPGDEVAMQITAQSPMTDSATPSITPLAVEGFARLLDTPTSEAVATGGDNDLGANAAQPAPIGEMPAPSSEPQLFGAEVAQQAVDSPGEQPMPGAVQPIVEAGPGEQASGAVASAAQPTGVISAQSGAALEMQAAAPPAAAYVNEPEVAQSDEESIAADAVENITHAGTDGVATSDTTTTVTPTPLVTEKDVQASPTPELPTTLPAPSVMPTNTTTVAQHQERTSHDQDDDRETPWLAFVGIITLVLSLVIGLYGWMKGRR